MSRLFSKSAPWCLTRFRNKRQSNTGRENYIYILQNECLQWLWVILAQFKIYNDIYCILFSQCLIVSHRFSFEIDWERLGYIGLSWPVETSRPLRPAPWEAFIESGRELLRPRVLYVNATVHFRMSTSSWSGKSEVAETRNTMALGCWRSLMVTGKSVSDKSFLSLKTSDVPWMQIHRYCAKSRSQNFFIESSMGAIGLIRRHFSITDHTCNWLEFPLEVRKISVARASLNPSCFVAGGSGVKKGGPDPTPFHTIPKEDCAMWLKLPFFNP